MALAAALILPALIIAQAAGGFPTATTLGTLTTFPNFYHQKDVVVRGRLVIDDAGQSRLQPRDGEGRGVALMVKGERPAEGNVEVRGQFWDVGRLAQTDPVVAAHDVQAFVQARLGDRWPAHGELLVLRVTGVLPAPPPDSTPTIRQIALEPERYEGEAVTVSGQFGGRNLFGDLAQGPRVGRFDFVLRAAGGAVWVTGVEPKGRGWVLRVDARMDTSQWLEATGTVRTGNGLVWIEAQRLALTKATPQQPPPAPAEPAIPVPPPEVIFSLPSDEDTDIPPSTTVRIQVSRDLAPETLAGHILVGYAGQAPGAASPKFSASFDRSNRVVTIAFAEPLEPFRTYRVELTEGIMGTDGQALEPWALTFTTGAR